jgi:hypothetical protein
MRNPNDRNRNGGDTNNMLLFNTVIQAHVWNKYPLKGGLTHGATCNTLHFLKNLIRFSPHLLGPLNSPIHYLSLYLDWDLIMYQSMCKLELI